MPADERLKATSWAVQDETISATDAIAMNRRHGSVVDPCAIASMCHPQRELTPSTASVSMPTAAHPYTGPAYDPSPDRRLSETHSR